MTRKRRKLIIALAAIAAAFVIVNLIFGYIVAGPDKSAEKRCVYSLYRLGVGLVEYANIHNGTLAPPTLQALVDEGIVEAGWLRCSEVGPEFGYFGQFDLLGPRPPVVLWCRSGHTAVIAGVPVRVVYVINGELKAVRYMPRLLEEELAELDEMRAVLAMGNSQEDVDRLLEYAAPESDSPVIAFAVYKLARMRSKRFENTFLALLEHEKGQVRHEAAEALALLGNPAGGAALLARLRKPDYFMRLRAFKALKQLAGDDFGFNPTLDSQSQPEAMSKFDAWWARTSQALRKEGSDK